MGSSEKKYALIECKDYLYCVPKKDLVTVDPSSVNEADLVSFRYGSQTLTPGTVLLFASKEKTVLEEMKRLRKEKKPPKKERSFHDDRPREAALKQREKMKVLKKPAKPVTSSKDVKQKAKKEKMAKKAKCEMVTEQQVDLQIGNNNSGCASGNSSSGSDSDNSSVKEADNLAAKSEKNKDIASLHALHEESSKSSLDGRDSQLHDALTAANDGIEVHQDAHATNDTQHPESSGNTGDASSVPCNHDQPNLLPLLARMMKRILTSLGRTLCQ